MVGEIAYFVAKGAEGLIARVTGKVVETKGDTVVVATRPCDVKGIPNHLLASAPGDHTEITFLRIPASSCVYSRPPVWLACDPGQLPDSDLGCMGRAWPRSVSSEAEKPHVEKKGVHARAQKPSFVRGLGPLQRHVSGEGLGEGQLRQRGPGPAKSEPEASASGRRQFFIPRASLRPEKEQPKKCFSTRYHADTVGEGDLRGQEPSRPHALPDDELHDGPALQGVEEKPSGTEADQEASAEDLQWRMGIVRGQSWTVRDYLKKQNWGKFKGIYRCAMMDAQAYEQYFAGSYRRLCATLPMHAALP